MTDSECPLTDDEFCRRLELLLERADRAGVTFDRSWTVSSDSDLDLMVEITRIRRKNTTP